MMLQKSQFCFMILAIVLINEPSLSVSKYLRSRITRQIHLWLNTIFNKQTTLSTKVAEELFVSDSTKKDATEIERFCPDESESDQMALLDYCENAFENKYFKKLNWGMRAEKLPRCIEMEVSLDRLNYSTTRFLLGCPAFGKEKDSEKDRHFSVYLAAPHTKYKNRSMYFVLLKKSHVDPETNEKVNHIEVNTLLINKNPVHPLISFISGLYGKKTSDKDEEGDGKADDDGPEDTANVGEFDEKTDGKKKNKTTDADKRESQPKKGATGKGKNSGKATDGDKTGKGGTSSPGKTTPTSTDKSSSPKKEKDSGSKSGGKTK